MVAGSATGFRALRVLFATSEIYPLVKTGGLADVSHALPKALLAAGVDVRVLVPAYRSVMERVELRAVKTGLDLIDGVAPATLRSGRLPASRVPLYALECAPLYERAGGPYQDEFGVDWRDNAWRFGALGRAAALLGSTASPLRWRPDVVHLNDWQTGLGAAYLAFDPERSARTVLSVHNVAFPGSFAPELIPVLGLPWHGFSVEGFEFYGLLSFLKAGVHYADHLTTVSPTYAAEIRDAALGGGLHGLFARRANSLTGILNGIDDEIWDPASDPHIARTYGLEDLDAKAENSRALRAELGLAEQGAGPILGFIGRLAHQKGIDLLVDAVRALIPARDFQLVVLGNGEPALEEAIEMLAQERPGRVRFRRGYDERLAHRIEAGADMFVMPSRYEPCGLNQMYSMRYGTPPLVHHTGGLADTVVDASPEAVAAESATGFSFAEPSADALAACLGRALDAHRDPGLWRSVQRAGMARDFSWRGRALEYRSLYESLRVQYAG